MDQQLKSAWVSIIGRPSAGKSTLMNTICGRKVAITSPVPQTTRNKIRGVLNHPQGQLVFVDTPGYHRSDKKFNTYLRDLSISSLQESDLILYVIDTRRPLGEEEAQIAALLKPLSEKVVCFLNKTDMMNTKVRPNLKAKDVDKTKGKDGGGGNYILGDDFLKAGFLQNSGGGDGETAAPVLFPHRIRGSALTGAGIQELVDVLFTLAPQGDPLYPQEFYTDQEPSFRIAEIIREKAFIRLRDEIPHALYVEIADLEDQQGVLWIRAFIMVERESQKGIVVGKQGAGLGAIRKETLKELREIFDQPLKLDLRVKAHPRWRRKDPLLKRLIY